MGIAPTPLEHIKAVKEVSVAMPDEKKAADPESPIFAVEKELPVGSVDKSRVGGEERDEQYPIPHAKPNPWQETT